MGKFGDALLGIVGAIITLAIISVIIGQKSKAPEVLQAGSSALANVIAAAVNPVATASTNSAPGANTFSAPAPQSQGSDYLTGLGNALMHPFSNFGGLLK